jgi:multidrug efflux pump subunit AcrA (membrane-fusion protein)
LLALAVAACGAIGGQTPTPLPTVVLGGANGTQQPTAQASSGGVATASGHVEPADQTQLVFATTGKVISLTVAADDVVPAGQVLAVLSGGDSLAAAVQTANLNVLNAQQALKDLQDAAAQSAAQAQVAVAQAQTALTKANNDLRSAQHPAGQSLYDAVNDAKLALDTAQANAQLATVSQPVQDYTSQYWLTDYYWKRYQDLQAKYNAAPNPDSLTKAQNAYNDWKVLADKQAQRQLTAQTDQANKNDSVSKAQKTYNDAVNNLNAALAGPDADKLAMAKSKLDVATTSLADAQQKLADLLAGGSADDVKTDVARVQAAQAVVNALTLTAPFDGDVLVVNDQPGDSASLTDAALTLANRSRYHVDVLVDEADVSSIKLGDPAQVTFSPLPDLVLSGTVGLIQPQGQTVQGLVKYTVRVELLNLDPRVLLGMTANVNIVTATEENALAVPLDAVQLDKQGEYVNRVNDAGVVERVPVVSGAVQDTLVIVKGNLKTGDKVQLIKPAPTTSGSPFGGGG